LHGTTVNSEVPMLFASFRPVHLRPQGIASVARAGESWVGVLSRFADGSAPKLARRHLLELLEDTAEVHQIPEPHLVRDVPDGSPPIPEQFFGPCDSHAQIDTNSIYRVSPPQSDARAILSAAVALCLPSGESSQGGRSA
jgi:hypothetical protein